MSEVTDLMVECLNELEEEGFQKQVIKENIKSVMASNIKSCMNSWGPVGKIIDKKIQESFSGLEKRLKLPDYNQFVAEQVESLYVEVMEADHLGHLKQLLQEKFKPIPKEVSCSSIMEELQDLITEQDECSCENFTLEIEEEYGSDNDSLYLRITETESLEVTKVIIYDHRSDEDRKDGKFIGTVGYINEDDKVLTGKSSYAARKIMNGVTEIFYRYYIARAQITVRKGGFYSVSRYDY